MEKAWGGTKHPGLQTDAHTRVHISSKPTTTLSGRTTTPPLPPQPQNHTPTNTLICIHHPVRVGIPPVASTVCGRVITESGRRPWRLRCRRSSTAGPPPADSSQDTTESSETRQPPTVCVFVVLVLVFVVSCLRMGGWVELGRGCLHCVVGVAMIVVCGQWWPPLQIGRTYG